MEAPGGPLEAPESWSLDKLMAVWQLSSQFLTQSSRRFLQREPSSSDLFCPTSWVRSSRPAGGSAEVICRNLQQNQSHKQPVKYHVAPMLPPAGESQYTFRDGRRLSPPANVLPLPWTPQVYEDAAARTPQVKNLCFTFGTRWRCGGTGAASPASPSPR